METMKNLTMTFILSFVIITSSFSQERNDIPGASDHKLISRYQGSYITHFSISDFEKYPYLIGKWKGSKEASKIAYVDGKVTRISYIAPENTSDYQILKNYEKELKVKGFDLIYSSSNIGAFYDFTMKCMPKNITEGSSPTDRQYNYIISENSAYLVGKKTVNNANTYVVIAASVNNYKEATFYAVEIIEEQQMETGLVQINLDYISEQINTNGKVAIYNILFDFDKATIKQESEKTLKIISEFLKNNPDISLYIVGHTDSKGSFEYNLNLSRNRAKSVVSYLTNKHGILSDRLVPEGVGPLAPVSTNDTEEGRKMNRRVELVKKH